MFQTGPLDFSLAMLRVCEDICARHGQFQHIDMSQVAVTFAQARSHVMHGLQAKLTPMRFENGDITARRDGQMWTVQRLFMEQREMLYILTFYLPRFLNQPFKEKLVTVVHELFHISARFDGDIRRLPGHYHVHSHSQKEYDDQMAVYVDEYLRTKPGPVLDFLKDNFQSLRDTHGGVVGLQVPIPKLIPCDERKSA